MATALGLNLSLAAMLTVVASALGWLGHHTIWGCWLALAGLLAILTTGRLCRAMAPLFWVSSATLFRRPV
ncbi:hypothetical protein [Hydrogenophaga sp.]|uniref:hypothetical protein n=1 Tax=Hydrogenophaga sp. TaxID=1904254 RepID=UPI0025C0AB78|nr:hypothetical protein [Hydrogenophaga sp.]MBT9465628.1 hypothetical protein [Hydrogenophaga sp.]